MPLACLALPLLLGGVQDLPVRNITLKSERNATREIKVVYPRFGGTQPLARLANRETRRSAESELKKWQKDAAGAGTSPGGGALSFEMTPKVFFAHPRLLSLTFSVSSFLGGPHGMHNYVPHSFGYVRGRPARLRLRDLFRPGVDARAEVSRRVIAKLRNDERADRVRGGEVKSLTAGQAERFVIGHTGLTFLFDPYEMGAYAAGTFEVPLSFRELRGPLDTSGPLGAFVNPRG